MFHPDNKDSGFGSKRNFQELQEAYEKLNQFILSGGSLQQYSENQNQASGKQLNQEDLEKMFYEQIQKENEKVYKETYKSYEDILKEQKIYEKWKNQRFSQYDREKHDQFISKRYSELKNNDEFYQSQNHFTPQDRAEKGPQNSPVSKKKSQSKSGRYFEYEEEKKSKQHNTQKRKIKFKFSGFLFDQNQRNQFIEKNYDQILYSIIIFGLCCNFFVYKYVQKQKQIKQQQRIEQLINQREHQVNVKNEIENFISNQKIENEYKYEPVGSIEYPQNLIYIDNKIVLEYNLQLKDIERMYDQPNRFQLSNYLKNRVVNHRNNLLFLQHINNQQK